MAGSHAAAAAARERERDHPSVRPSVPSCRTFLRRCRWRLFGQAVGRAQTADRRGTPGQQTVQYNITIRATATSHRRRYNAVTAQHINRGCTLARSRPLSFRCLSPSPASLFPRGAASVPPPRPSRTLPSTWLARSFVGAFLSLDRAPSRFHLAGRLYLIGRIINHRLTVRQPCPVLRLNSWNRTHRGVRAAVFLSCDTFFPPSPPLRAGATAAPGREKSRSHESGEAGPPRASRRRYRSAGDLERSISRFSEASRAAPRRASSVPIANATLSRKRGSIPLREFSAFLSLPLG